jgi:hypothetical protein
VYFERFPPIQDSISQLLSWRPGWNSKANSSKTEDIQKILFHFDRKYIREDIMAFRYFAYSVITASTAVTAAFAYDRVKADRIEQKLLKIAKANIPSEVVIKEEIKDFEIGKMSRKYLCFIWLSFH